MKTLSNYVLEKLNIDDDGIVEPQYNPDELTNDEEVLYSDMEEDNAEDEWDCFKEDLKYLEDKYYGFLCTQFDPLSNISVKNLERTIYRNSTSLDDDIVSEIVNGKDLGYEITLVGGHLEIDCINSGSRGTYYIYGFNKHENYAKVEAWAASEISNETLYTLLNKEGFIAEITFK